MMAGVRELIEAGRAPRENERALVVVDEAPEAEVELSFYDYQLGRFIGPQGLISEAHFFRAPVARINEKQGYLVGPEVTRYLRHHALIGIASRAGPLGDVPSDVRTYRLVELAATIDIPRPKPLDVGEKQSEIQERGIGVDRAGVGRDRIDDNASDRRPDGKPSDQPQLSELGPTPEQKARRRRQHLVFATKLLILLVVMTVPFAITRLGWYGFVIAVKGSLDFTQNLQQSTSEAAAFSPETTRVEIRRAVWVRPFEGWWITDKPPAQIEFDNAGWLSKEDQSQGRKIVVVIRPTSSVTNATEILRSQLAFRNTNTRQIFDKRQATLRLASPGQLQIESDGPLAFAGFKGGPFNPASAQVTLAALGGDIRWSAQEVPTWIGLSGGTAGLLKKDSSAKLTVAPRGADLAAGVYEAPLQFRNEVANKASQQPIRLVVLDSALECDRRMASRFDPDRPPKSPFIVDISTLSDDELQRAMRACAAAFQSESSAASRRFVAEIGRAYAARAVRLAKAHAADKDVRMAMSDAVEFWQDAAAKGSTAAMNFLGNYWAGWYDDQANPAPSGKCASTTSRIFFTTSDMKMARDYWEQAAKARSPNFEAMTNYGRLLVMAPDLCPPLPGLQNISEGITWLKTSAEHGDFDAAAVLGELFYRGRVPSSAAPNNSFPRRIDEGLRWLAMACKEGSVRAKDFVGGVISTREMDPTQRPTGC